MYNNNLPGVNSLAKDEIRDSFYNAIFESNVGNKTRKILKYATIKRTFTLRKS